MGFRQSIGDLQGDVERLGQIKAITFDFFRKHFAVDILHRNERKIAFIIDFVNRADVGVIEPGSGLGFAKEASDPFAVFTEFSRQNLQSNFAIELRVLRQIHFAHPALADL